MDIDRSDVISLAQFTGINLLYMRKSSITQLAKWLTVYTHTGLIICTDDEIPVEREFNTRSPTWSLRDGDDEKRFSGRRKREREKVCLVGWLRQ